VCGAGEVDTSNLQVATVNKALVERDVTVDAYFLVGAASLGIEGAFDQLSLLLGRKDVQYPWKVFF